MGIKQQLFIAMLMVASSFLGFWMFPQSGMGQLASDVTLEKLIPHQFGDWIDDEQTPALVVNPDVQQELKDVYSQMLSRTYRNKVTGEHIMLAIAYGGEQSRSLQVHRPEVCYAAQGFYIADKNKAILSPEKMAIPVMQLLAINKDENRHEPITYWIRIGDEIVRGNLEQGFARLKYGLRRTVPDGLLFRVSSIDSDTVHAHQLQQQYIEQLVSALSDDGRRFLLGKK